MSVATAQPRGSMARSRGSAAPALAHQDPMLLLVAGALLAIGVVMVASASMPQGMRSGEPLRFVERHMFALVLGLGGAVGAWFTSMARWERWSTWLYFLGLGLLALVFVPGLGREANGAMRWVGVGPLSLQTSEFMKLFVVLYMAGYVVRHKFSVVWEMKGFVRPMLLLLMACGLIMLQPDFGTTAVLLATAFGMLFLAGAQLWQFGVLILCAAGALAALVYVSPYRMARVTSFLNPWEQARDAGYQLTQALIAFGRGEWTGVGLGNGIQKQFYLPEAHTDFVMAVIGEEFGLLGSLVVVLLFGLFVWRAFAIGARAERRGARFAAFVAYGVGLWIGMQAFINIGVNMGLLPTKGLTLPFISYGSNSLIACCIAVGLLARVHRENSEAGDAREGKWQRA